MTDMTSLFDKKNVLYEISSSNTLPFSYKDIEFPLNSKTPPPQYSDYYNNATQKLFENDLYLEQLVLNVENSENIPGAEIQNNETRVMNAEEGKKFVLTSYVEPYVRMGHRVPSELKGTLSAVEFFENRKINFAFYDERKYVVGTETGLYCSENPLTGWAPVGQNDYLLQSFSSYDCVCLIENPFFRTEGSNFKKYQYIMGTNGGLFAFVDYDVYDPYWIKLHHDFSEPVMSIMPDNSSKGMYIGTSNGLFYSDGISIKRVNKSKGKHFTDVAVLGNENLIKDSKHVLAATDHGIFQSTLGYYLTDIQEIYTSNSGNIIKSVYSHYDDTVINSLNYDDDIEHPEYYYTGTEHVIVRTQLSLRKSERTQVVFDLRTTDEYKINNGIKIYDFTIIPGQYNDAIFISIGNKIYRVTNENTISEIKLVSTENSYLPGSSENISFIDSYTPTRALCYCKNTKKYAIFGSQDTEISFNIIGTTGFTYIKNIFQIANGTTYCINAANKEIYKFEESTNIITVKKYQVLTNGLMTDISDYIYAGSNTNYAYYVAKQSNKCVLVRFSLVANETEAVVSNLTDASGNEILWNNFTKIVTMLTVSDAFIVYDGNLHRINYNNSKIEKYTIDAIISDTKITAIGFVKIDDILNLVIATNDLKIYQIPNFNSRILNYSTYIDVTPDDLESHISGSLNNATIKSFIFRSSNQLCFAILNTNTSNLLLKMNIGGTYFIDGIEKVENEWYKNIFHNLSSEISSSIVRELKYENNDLVAIISSKNNTFLYTGTDSNGISAKLPANTVAIAASPLPVYVNDKNNKPIKLSDSVWFVGGEDGLSVLNSTINSNNVIINEYYKIADYLSATNIYSATVSNVGPYSIGKLVVRDKLLNRSDRLNIYSSKIAEKLVDNYVVGPKDNIFVRDITTIVSSGTKSSVKIFMPNTLNLYIDTLSNSNVIDVFDTIDANNEDALVIPPIVMTKQDNKISVYASKANKSFSKMLEPRPDPNNPSKYIISNLTLANNFKRILKGDNISAALNTYNPNFVTRMNDGDIIYAGLSNNNTFAIYKFDTNYSTEVDVMFDAFSDDPPYRHSQIKVKPVSYEISANYLCASISSGGINLKISSLYINDLSVSVIDKNTNNNYIKISAANNSSTTHKTIKFNDFAKVKEHEFNLSLSYKKTSRISASTTALFDIAISGGINVNNQLSVHEYTKIPVLINLLSTSQMPTGSDPIHITANDSTATYDYALPNPNNLFGWPNIYNTNAKLSITTLPETEGGSVTSLLSSTIKLSSNISCKYLTNSTKISSLSNFINNNFLSNVSFVALSDNCIATTKSCKFLGITKNGSTLNKLSSLSDYVDSKNDLKYTFRFDTTFIPIGLNRDDLGANSIVRYTIPSDIDSNFSVNGKEVTLEYASIIQSDSLSVSKNQNIVENSFQTYTNLINTNIYFIIKNNENDIEEEEIPRAGETEPEDTIKNAESGLCKLIYNSRTKTFSEISGGYLDIYPDKILAIDDKLYILKNNDLCCLYNDDTIEFISANITDITTESIFSTVDSRNLFVKNNSKWKLLSTDFTINANLEYGLYISQNPRQYYVLDNKNSNYVVSELESFFDLRDSFLEKTYHKCLLTYNKQNKNYEVLDKIKNFILSANDSNELVISYDSFDELGNLKPVVFCDSDERIEALTSDVGMFEAFPEAAQTGNTYEGLIFIKNTSPDYGLWRWTISTDTNTAKYKKYPIELENLSKISSIRDFSKILTDYSDNSLCSAEVLLAEKTGVYRLIPSNNDAVSKFTNTISMPINSSNELGIAWNLPVLISKTGNQFKLSVLDEIAKNRNIKIKELSAVLDANIITSKFDSINYFSNYAVIDKKFATINSIDEKNGKVNYTDSSLNILSNFSNDIYAYNKCTPEKYFTYISEDKAVFLLKSNSGNQYAVYKNIVYTQPGGISELSLIINSGNITNSVGNTQGTTVNADIYMLGLLPGATNDLAVSFKLSAGNFIFNCLSSSKFLKQTRTVCSEMVANSNGFFCGGGSEVYFYNPIVNDLKTANFPDVRLETGEFGDFVSPKGFICPDGNVITFVSNRTAYTMKSAGLEMELDNPTGEYSILHTKFLDENIKTLVKIDDENFIIGTNDTGKYVKRLHTIFSPKDFQYNEKLSGAVNSVTMISKPRNGDGQVESKYVYSAGNSVYSSKNNIELSREIKQVGNEKTVINNIYSQNGDMYFICANDGLYVTEAGYVLENDLENYSIDVIKELQHDQLNLELIEHKSKFHNLDSKEYGELLKFENELIKKSSTKPEEIPPGFTTDNTLGIYNETRIIRNDVVETIEFDDNNHYIKASVNNWAVKNLNAQNIYSDDDYYDRVTDPIDESDIDLSKVSYVYKKWNSGLKEFDIYVPTTLTYYINNPKGFSNSLYANGSVPRKNVPGSPVLGNVISDKYTSLRLILDNNHFGIKNVYSVQIAGNSLPLRIYKDAEYCQSGREELFDTVMQPSVLNSIFGIANSDTEVNNANSLVNSSNNLVLEFSIYGTDAQSIKILAE